MKSKYLFSTVDSDIQKTRYIAKFISQFQSDDRSLVGNFGYSTTEIENQLKEYMSKQPQSFSRLHRMIPEKSVVFLELSFLNLIPFECLDLMQRILKMNGKK